MKPNQDRNLQAPSDPKREHQGATKFTELSGLCQPGLPDSEQANLLITTKVLIQDLKRCTGYLQTVAREVELHSHPKI